MSIDLIGQYLSLNQGQFKLIPEEDWKHYPHIKNVMSGTLSKAHYSNPYPYYMPSIDFSQSSNGNITLHYQVNPAKTLHGNNTYEVKESEFPELLKILTKQLKLAGFIVEPEVLSKHYLSSLHVNKIAVWPYISDLAMKILQETPSRGRMTKAVSLYPSSGKVVYNNLKHRKFKIYDKKAQVADDDAIPLAEKQFISELPFSIFNMEFKMEKKQEIDREFRTQNISLTNTLENAFKQEVQQPIVKNRLEAFLSEMLTVDRLSILEQAYTYCKHNDIRGSQKRTAIAGAAALINMFGFEAYKKYLYAGADRKSVNDYISELRDVNFPTLPEELSLKNCLSNTAKDWKLVSRGILEDTSNAIRKGFFPPVWACNTRVIPTESIIPVNPQASSSYSSMRI